MTLVGRVAGLNSLEDLFFFSVFFLPFKTEIAASLIFFFLFAVIKNSQEMLIRTAYVIKHDLKVGYLVLTQ